VQASSQDILTVVEVKATPAQRDKLADDDGNGGPPRLVGQDVSGVVGVEVCSKDI